MNKNIGGSILPSSDRFVLQAKSGLHGTFETRALPELDTHGLFYARSNGEFAGHFILIAMHPNGYSCDELAKRILDAWKCESTPERAVQQHQYILDCGGLGQSISRIESLVNGSW